MSRIRSHIKLPNYFSSSQNPYRSKYKNLLFSGCSFSYNISHSTVETWPWMLASYLDITNTNHIFDCSQSASGPILSFNSILYELEVNPHNIDFSDTLIVIMWSGLNRFDWMSPEPDKFSSMSLPEYNFNEYYYNNSLRYYLTDNRSEYNNFLKECITRRIVSPGLTLQSMFKISGLKQILEAQGIDHIFTSWMDPTIDLEKVKIDTAFKNKILNLMNIPELLTLDEYAEKTNQRIGNGDTHPNPTAHKEWVEKHLIPFMEKNNYISR